jgi:hypothetical protein
MRHRHTSQHRVRLECTVSHQIWLAFKRRTSGVVILVPGGERRDDHARVNGWSHRRVRSRDSRTCAAVSRGSLVSGTATETLPLRLSCMGVGAAMISSLPSLAEISRAWPARRPSSSRNSLGTTIRPAASMVARMGEMMAFECHSVHGRSLARVRGLATPRRNAHQTAHSEVRLSRRKRR